MGTAWTGSADQQATQAKGNALWQQFMNDDKQCVPFRSSRSLEPAGYIVFTVWDAKMARRVEELFAIDFVFNEEKGCSLPLEIVNQIASIHSRRIQQ